MHTIPKRLAMITGIFTPFLHMTFVRNPADITAVNTSINAIVKSKIPTIAIFFLFSEASCQRNLFMYIPLSSAIVGYSWY